MAKVLGAAFRGKLAKLQKLLEEEDPSLLECESVDYADANGNTALHAACQEGHEDCVALLLRVGAIVDRAGAGGVTPLIVACENGRIGVAKQLIGAKANVAFADAEHGATALHSACQVGSADCVEALLTARAPLDAIDKAGASALVIAAYGGHARCVELLMGAGADDGLEYEGKLAVELAEEAGHAECVRVLSSAGKTEEEMSADEKKSAAREQLAGNPSAQAGARSLAEAEARMGTAGGEEAQEDISTETLQRPKQGEDLLSQLQRGIQENNLMGGDLIEQKREEMEAMGRAHEEREKKEKEKAEAEQRAKEAARPKSAAEAKARANALFGKGRVAEAASMYQAALNLAQGEMTNSDSTESDDPSVATGDAEPPARAVLHCNLAACRLRQRMWREAVEACDSACDLHARYTKALYRRAQAKRALREWEGAMEDAKAAHEALCRAGDGKPVGEAGRKTAAEIEKFAQALRKEKTAADADVSDQSS